MKMKSILIPAICMMPFISEAQWAKLSTPTSKDLEAACFLNESLGYVAGNDGVMLKTTDGGNSWISLNTAFGEDIKSMFFIDANTGWIAGKDGKIKKTTDGGANWISQTTAVDAELKSIHFIDVNNGMAVGKDGAILLTTNGGSIWTLSPASQAGGAGSGSGSSGSGGGSDLSRVQLVAANRAYICGKDGLFAVSTDGGMSWTAQSAGTTADLEGMHFSSAGNGYVCYQTGGVRKTNGNGSFTSVTANTSKDLKSIYFITDAMGWTVGEEGRIQYTENSGSTWTEENNSAVTADLNAVWMASQNVGYIAGDHGVVLKYIRNGNPDPNPSAISNVNRLNDVKVYPNPLGSASFLTIDWSDSGAKNVSIIVYNIAGQKVYEGIASPAKQSVEINTRDWAQGSYQILIIAGNKKAAHTIIK